MTTFNLYAGLDAFASLDIFSLDFDQPKSVTYSTTSISGYADGFFLQLGGRFTLDANGPTGGNLTSIAVSYGNSLLATVTGFDIDILETANSTKGMAKALFGGPDTITSALSLGDSYATFDGDDFVKLGNGDDFVDGGKGRDTFAVDANFDPTQIELANAAVRITSAQGVDTLSNIEIVRFLDVSVALQVAGTTGATLTGDANPGVTLDYLFGRVGNDTLLGGADRDWLFGNDGNDNLRGGAGNDVLNGGNQDDILSGDQGSDFLLGGFGDDRMNGGAANDRVMGQRGNDKLNGGAGKDALFGGQGRDLLQGQKGDDVLTGEAGKDIFLFHKGHGHDQITDFELGVDLIKIGRGANDLSDLAFQRMGHDVMISFANVEILVENVKIGQINDAAHFIF